MNKIDFKESVYEAMLKSFYRFLDDLDNDFYNFRLRNILDLGKDKEDKERFVNVRDKDIIKALDDDLYDNFINDLLYTKEPNNFNAAIKLLELLKQYTTEKNRVKLTDKQLKELASRFVLEELNEGSEIFNEKDFDVKTFDKLMNFLYKNNTSLTTNEISYIKNEIIKIIKSKDEEKNEPFTQLSKLSIEELKDLAVKKGLYNDLKNLKIDSKDAIIGFLLAKNIGLDKEEKQDVKKEENGMLNDGLKDLIDFVFWFR